MQVKKLRNLTDQQLIDLVKNSESLRDVLRKLDIPTTNGTARLYLQEFIKDNNLREYLYKRKYSKEDLEIAVKNAICWVDVLRYFRLNDIGGNRRTIQKYVTKFEIDISHFNIKLANARDRKQLTKELIICENSNVTRNTLKSYVLKHNLIENVCRDCGLTNLWNDKPLVLHIEHINGINNDNRIENLAFLCPNCHSQTNTYAGRNSILDKNDI